MQRDIKNLQVLVWVLFGFCILNLLLTITFMSGNRKSSTDVSETQGTPTTLDVSKMNTITTKEAVDLIKSKEKVVLFIGGSDCAFCVRFAPVLVEAQEKYHFVTNYVDITKMDADSTEYEELVNLMGNEITLTVNNEEQTKTLGNWLKEKGYTPTLAIFEDGKMVDGLIGYTEIDPLSEILEKIYQE